jgi:hypothetical protein
MPLTCGLSATDPVRDVEQVTPYEHRRAGRWTALTSPSSQVHLNSSHQL